MAAALNGANVCRRCKGKRQVHGEEGGVMSCPDCEGTGEEFVCDECHGTGQVCVGTSGLESDGNAPVMERCPMCGYA